MNLEHLFQNWNELTIDQKSKIALYEKELKRFKNLFVTKIKPEKQILSLIEDSLLASNILLQKIPKKVPLVEIGAGAGYIGVILACVSKERHSITLVEPSELRSQFLSHCVRTLGLSHCIKVRKEPFKKTKAQFLLFKAFAPFKKTLHLLDKFTEKKTISYHFKSESWFNDWNSLSREEKTRWKATSIGSYPFESKTRYIIEVQRRFS